MHRFNLTRSSFTSRSSPAGTSPLKCVESVFKRSRSTWNNHFLNLFECTSTNESRTKNFQNKTSSANSIFCQKFSNCISAMEMVDTFQGFTIGIRHRLLNRDLVLKKCKKTGLRNTETSNLTFETFLIFPRAVMVLQSAEILQPDFRYRLCYLTYAEFNAQKN